jgi:DNA-binding MarR family transcriptional regulator
MSRDTSSDVAAQAPRGKRAVRKSATSFDFQSDALGYRLRLAQVRAFDLFFKTLAPLDLTPARVTALSLIAMNPGINQSALAKELDVAGPSVLKVIDMLEAAGWVRRDDVAGDRRRYSLEITEQGHAQLELLREKLAAYEIKLSAGFSAAERRSLMEMLDRLAR